VDFIALNNFDIRSDTKVPTQIVNYHFTDYFVDLRETIKFEWKKSMD